MAGALICGVWGLGWNNAVVQNALQQKVKCALRHFARGQKKLYFEYPMMQSVFS